MSIQANFLVALANEIDMLTNQFVFNGYQALATLLKAPIGAALVLYIVLMGYAIVRGLIQSPQQELMKFSIRAGLIFMFALNWGMFANYCRDFFVIGSETIASTLTQAVHKSINIHSINQGLQSVLNEVLDLGAALFAKGSIRKLPPYFSGFMVLLSGVITIGLAFVEILIAKLMLAITLCTAPLFISLTLFEQTKGFFERWLGILVGFSLVLVFVSAVIGLCLHMIHWTVSGVGEELNIAVWVPLLITACLCILSISTAAGIGKSIGGAIGTSSGAALVGGFIGGALGAASQTKAMGKLAYGKTLKNPMDTAKAFARNTASRGFNKLQQSIRRGGA